VSYFAAALARSEQGWTGVELDLDEVDDLESLADLPARPHRRRAPGPALLLLEEDDEHLAVVRVDGGAGSLAEPRVLPVRPARRARQRRRGHAVGGRRRTRPATTTTTRAPARSPSPSATRRCSADLGHVAQDLLDLCAEEGLLPADVLTTVCERAGCDDVLERLREG
jgi:putative tRNA adenosine deaminase-associated protein